MYRYPLRTTPWKPVKKSYAVAVIFYLVWMALVIYGLTTI